MLIYAIELKVNVNVIEHISYARHRAPDDITNGPDPRNDRRRNYANICSSFLRSVCPQSICSCGRRFHRSYIDPAPSRKFAPLQRHGAVRRGVREGSEGGERGRGAREGSEGGERGRGAREGSEGGERGRGAREGSQGGERGRGTISQVCTTATAWGS